MTLTTRIFRPLALYFCLLLVWQTEAAKHRSLDESQLAVRGLDDEGTTGESVPEGSVSSTSTGAVSQGCVPDQPVVTTGDGLAIVQFNSGCSSRKRQVSLFDLQLSRSGSGAFATIWSTPDSQWTHQVNNLAGDVGFRVCYGGLCSVPVWVTVYSSSQAQAQNQDTGATSASVGLPAWLIALMIVLALLVIAAIVAAILIARRRRQHKKQPPVTSDAQGVDGVYPVVAEEEDEEWYLDRGEVGNEESFPRPVHELLSEYKTHRSLKRKGADASSSADSWDDDDEREWQRLTQAATIIQAAWRGYVVRNPRVQQVEIKHLSVVVHDMQMVMHTLQHVVYSSSAWMEASDAMYQLLEDMQRAARDLWNDEEIPTDIADAINLLALAARNLLQIQDSDQFAAAQAEFERCRVLLEERLAAMPSNTMASALRTRTWSGFKRLLREYRQKRQEIAEQDTGDEEQQHQLDDLLERFRIHAEAMLPYDDEESESSVSQSDDSTASSRRSSGSWQEMKRLLNEYRQARHTVPTNHHEESERVDDEENGDDESFYRHHGRPVSADTQARRLSERVQQRLAKDRAERRAKSTPSAEPTSGYRLQMSSSAERWQLEIAEAERLEQSREAFLTELESVRSWEHMKEVLAQRRSALQKLSELTRVQDESHATSSPQLLKKQGETDEMLLDELEQAAAERSWADIRAAIQAADRTSSRHKSSSFDRSSPQLTGSVSGSPNLQEQLEERKEEPESPSMFMRASGAWARMKDRLNEYRQQLRASASRDPGLEPAASARRPLPRTGNRWEARANVLNRLEEMLEKDSHNDRKMLDAVRHVPKPIIKPGSALTEGTVDSHAVAELLNSGTLPWRLRENGSHNVKFAGDEENSSSEEETAESASEDHSHSADSSTSFGSAIRSTLLGSPLFKLTPIKFQKRVLRPKGEQKKEAGRRRAGLASDASSSMSSEASSSASAEMSLDDDDVSTVAAAKKDSDSPRLLRRRVKAQNESTRRAGTSNDADAFEEEERATSMKRVSELRASGVRVSIRNSNSASKA